jgi:epoxyqueuosine reductase
MLTFRLVREKALELGFDLIGAAPAGPAPGAQAFLEWLRAGHAGEMAYLGRDPQRRADPRQVLPGARSVVVAGVSYAALELPREVWQDPVRGRIARYAWGADYHDVLTPRLKQLGAFIAGESRAYVDTGPVLEKAWAEACGLGFIGNNTCLIHRSRGSYLFLGAVLVGEEIAPDPDPEPAGAERKARCGCGRCRRCLDACPTQAFPAPGVLDARRCISYLTIELKGSIPVDLRPRMGNWIFGCDVCQEVCPYVRRYTLPSTEPAFRPISHDRAAPRLTDVLGWDGAAFDRLFRGTAVRRAKWRGLLRNACVAAGNSACPELLPMLGRLRDGDDPVVGEHADWAIQRITS